MLPIHAMAMIEVDKAAVVRIDRGEQIGPCDGNRWIGFGVHIAGILIEVGRAAPYVPRLAEQLASVTHAVRRGWRRSAVAVGIACIVATAPPTASAARKTLKAAGQSRVVQVLNGNTVRLASGDTARLAGVDAPRLGRRNDIPWPHAGQAQRALSSLVLQKTVRLFHAGRRVDRYGRLIVHVFIGDLWVQEALVKTGHVRVRSYADNRLRIPALLALEASARQEKKGLWQHNRYAIRSPETVTRDLDSWQIVEGTVKDVASLKRVTYLNFGDNWRKDFTIQINARARRLFAKADVNLKDLKGRKVRVRGWVRSRNGPLIVATHPEQLEILKTPDQKSDP